MYVVTIFGFAYLFIPLLTIAVFSFNDPEGKFNTEWERVHARQLAQPVPQPATTPTPSSCRCRVAFVACTLATVLGALDRPRPGPLPILGGTWLNLLLILPLTTPEIVFGASLFTLFFNQGVDRGFWTIVIAHTMFCLSFVALTVKARIRGLDWSLEDAAADLGSPPLRTFFTITLPLIMPGVFAAFLLSLSLSIDDYIITSFIAGNVSTFPRRDLRLGRRSRSRRRSTCWRR